MEENTQHTPAEEDAGRPGGGPVENLSGAAGEPVTWRPKRKMYPSWIDLLAIVGIFFGAAYIGKLFSDVLTQRLGAPAEAGSFAAYLTQFTLTIAFALSQKSLRSDDRPLLHAKGTGTPWTVLWGTVLLLAMSVVIEPLIALFPTAHFELLLKVIGTGGWVVVTTVVSAPILEEILFRGVIQDGAMRKYGPAGGVLIAATIFALIHIIPPQVVNAFFLGLVLGLVYYVSRSLVPVVLIHAVNNAIAYIGIVLSDGKILTTRQMLGNDRTFFILYAVSAAIVVCGFAYALRVLRRRPGGKRTKTAFPEGSPDNNKDA